MPRHAAIFLLLLSTIFLPTHAHAALNITKTGNLTATNFDELGFDPTGLVGYWQLNGNAKDSSGYHNDGTIVGATATTDRFGVAGQALNFNGNYVTIPHSSSLLLETITVTVWVRSTSNASTYQQGIVGKANLYGASEGGWMLRKGKYGGSGSSAPNDNKFYFSTTYYPREVYVPCSNVAYTDNAWHFIVCIHDGVSFNESLYVDGVKQTIVRTAGGSLNPFIQPVTIGRAYGDAFNASYESSFTGQIDEVKIFSRVLSAAEILAMYNHEKGKFSVGKDGTDKAVSFVEDPALPVQMRSKKQSLTVKGHLIQN